MYNFIEVNLVIIVFYFTNLMKKDIADDIISDTGRSTVFEKKLFERGLLADMPIKYTVWNVSKYGVFSDPYFPHSDWIRRDTSYLSVFSPNAGKYGPEKTPYLDTFHAVVRFDILQDVYITSGEIFEIYIVTDKVLRMKCDT